MENFFSSLKTERVRARIYRLRNAARTDLFDYVERFYNPVRGHSTIGYLRPVLCEETREKLKLPSMKPAEGQDMVRISVRSGRTS